MEDFGEKPTYHSHHPFWARFYSGLILLILAFFGLIFTQIKHQKSFNYWLYVTPLFAIIPLCLSWYLRHKKASLSFAMIWHELLHWAGLLVAVFLVSELVRIGLISRFAASLVVLTLIAFSFYLAGIYIEFTFLIIGIVIGLFIVVVAFMAEYLYFITIPLVVIAIALLFFFGRKKNKHT